jgi:acylglycerol lipase
MLTDIFQKSAELLDVHAKNFYHPLLVTHGSLDTLTCPKASKEFVDKVPSIDKIHVLYDKYVHELHNEPLEDREKVYEEYTNWITARV